jgi:Flp pilus assembly pilin Flp
MTKSTLLRFARDERGFLVSAELIIISTILVIGLIVGLVELQGALIHELNDVGEAIGSINQSYSFPGTNTWKGGHIASTWGSAFFDGSDVCCCDCNQGASLFRSTAVVGEGKGSVGVVVGGSVPAAPMAPRVIATPVPQTPVIQSAPVIQHSPVVHPAPVVVPQAAPVVCPPVGPVPQSAPVVCPPVGTTVIQHAAPVVGPQFFSQPIPQSTRVVVPHTGPVISVPCPVQGPSGVVVPPSTVVPQAAPVPQSAPAPGK